MTFEVEQKFRLTDVAAFETKLVKLGTVIGVAVTQADRYFNHPARDFAKTDEALRIRSAGEQNFVTYKGPKIDATTKTRREIELAVPPGDEGARQFADLLVALGFREVATVRKQRRTARCNWEGWAAEIALDDVEGVGQFCEIEFVAQEADLPAAAPPWPAWPRGWSCETVSDAATWNCCWEREKRAWGGRLIAGSVGKCGRLSRARGEFHGFQRRRVAVRTSFRRFPDLHGAIKLGW